VLRSFSMDCSSPISMKSLLKIPISEFSSTGGRNPHWSIYCDTPKVFKQTDLPPALGPEISRIWFWSSSSMSSGTISLPSRFRASISRGCTALRKYIFGDEWRIGLAPATDEANSPLALKKSISPKKSYDWSNSVR